MADYLLSILFGIIEGLTEFLPISSTAHLRIAQALAGIDLDDGYWKMYSIVIQLGAILSILVYFRRRILQFVLTFPRGTRRNRNILNHPVTLTLIAFFMTAAPVWYLKHIGVIDENLESLWLIGTSLMVGGVVMWAVDSLFIKPRTLDLEQMTVPQAIWIGLMQTLSAAFPGTSRSMSTIAAGQTASMSREAALEFSFFLCIPTMIAATGKELFDTLSPKHDATATTQAAAQLTEAAGSHALATLTGHQWGVLLVGFVVSFLVAWAVIAWFMHWVRKHGFMPFAIYRLALGFAVLLWAHK